MSAYRKQPWTLRLSTGPVRMVYCATRDCWHTFPASTGAIVCTTCAQLPLRGARNFRYVMRT